MTKNKASIWKQRFENREQKLKPLFEDARKYYDILYAAQKTKGISPWKSKVYVPVLASKAWDLISRLSDVVPLFNVQLKGEIEINADGNYEKPAVVLEREQRIEAKLQDDYMCVYDEPIKLKVFNPLVDAVAAGTGYAYAGWALQKKRQRVRKFDSEENPVGIPLKKTVKYGHNTFEGINFFNVFPGDGPSFQEIPYLIVRGYKPLYKLKSQGFQNLDKVKKQITTNTDFQLNNEARNRVVNEQDDIYKDDTVEMVTYYECYERTADGITLTVYAEGESSDPDSGDWIEIKPKEIPFWHDFYPVVPFYTRKKSFSPFGESLFENNRTLQNAVNDLFNHYLDNWNLSIDSMLMYEDGTLTNDFIIEPGGEITFTGEPPKQFKFPEPNPTQLSVVMNVLEKGIENATFSQYASGVPNSQTDKTQGTAYGIKTITEAATNKMGFFRDNFKQSMKLLGTIWLSNLQQFESMPSEVTRVVNGRPTPDVVVPSDYQGEAVLDIDDDSMIPISKQEKLERHERFINSVLMQQKAALQQMAVFKQPSDVPRFNFLEMFDDTARLSSIKDVDRYLLDNTVEIPQDAPQKTEPTPQEKVLDNISKKYDKAEPDIQSQLEEMAGLDPSGMHDSTIVNKAIKMGAEQAQIENPMGGQNGEFGQGAGAPSAATPGDSSGGAAI